MVDIALAAVDIAAMVFVMNDGGRFHSRHLLAEARLHLALVLRGRSREPGPDERIVDAPVAAHCLDTSEPRTPRGQEPGYLGLSTSDQPRRPDQSPGQRETLRIPLRYNRAVLAGAVAREQLRTGAGYERAYDVAAHQQAAMPERPPGYRDGPTAGGGRRAAGGDRPDGADGPWSDAAW